MRIKDKAQLEALIQASEARAAGLKVVNPLANRTVKLPPSLQPAPAATLPDNSRPQCRIIGIDTALRKTGWGIIDAAHGLCRAVDCGVIINQPTVKVSDCLRKLNGAIKSLLTEYHPDIAVIEGGFYCKNVRTAIILGTARGAVLGVFAEAEVPVFEYAPRRVKQAVCGFGNASKAQVARLISQRLNIKVENLADDATDALALTLCHAQNMATAGGFGLPEEL